MTEAPKKAMLFYPYLPKYRKDIINSLLDLEKVEWDVFSGREMRDDIEALTETDVSRLKRLKSSRLGPFSLHHGLLGHAVGTRYGVAVLSPATSSLTVWLVLVIRRVMRRSTFLWGQCGRPGERTGKRCLQEVMNRLAHGLLVYGESAKEAACELGTPRTKVSIVGNAFGHPGAGDSSHEELRAKARMRGIGVSPPSGVVRLLYVGRITVGKRLDRLVDAVELMQERGLLVSASIVGGGEAVTRLRCYAATRNLPIALPGPEFSDTKLRAYFDEATVVASPNTIGLLATEALRHNVPVIFPRNVLQNGPEAEALTPGLNSIEFNELTAKGLADAVGEWLLVSSTLNVDSFLTAVEESLEPWTPRSVAQRIVAAIVEID